MAPADWGWAPSRGSAWSARWATRRSCLDWCWTRRDPGPGDISGRPGRCRARSSPWRSPCSWSCHLKRKNSLYYVNYFLGFFFVKTCYSWLHFYVRNKILFVSAFFHVQMEALKSRAKELAHIYLQICQDLIFEDFCSLGTSRFLKHKMYLHITFLRQPQSKLLSRNKKYHYPL